MLLVVFGVSCSHDALPVQPAPAAAPSRCTQAGLDALAAAKNAALVESGLLDLQVTYTLSTATEEGPLRVGARVVAIESDGRFDPVETGAAVRIRPNGQRGTVTCFVESRWGALAAVRWDPAEWRQWLAPFDTMTLGVAYSVEDMAVLDEKNRREAPLVSLGAIETLARPEWVSPAP